MLITFSILLIIIGLIRKESKALFYIIWLLLLLLLGGNTENPDRIAYVNSYEQTTFGVFESSFEYGFQILCQIGTVLDLSYEQFIFVIAFIGLTLIASTIKLFTSNSAYALVLYSIYPFILDVVQIRNFLAMSIIIYGSRYILTYKKEYIKYILCVIIASSVHISALFYFSGLAVAVKNTRKIFANVVIVTISSIYLMPIILPQYAVVTSIEKIEAYTLTETSMLTKAAVIIYFVFSIALVLIARNLLNKARAEENPLVKNRLMEFDPEVVLKMNILCILLLYLLIDNLNFFRLYRNIFVLNYILFALCLCKMKKSIMYYTFFCCILILVIASFGWFIAFSPVTNIIDPVFNSNAFF